MRHLLSSSVSGCDDLSIPQKEAIVSIYFLENFWKRFCSFIVPNIISVASVNNQGNLSCFSNYGRGIDVAAPGERIISTFPDNKYVYEDGTSMAAPFVTGVVALLKSTRPNLTPYQIKQIIKENVKKSDSLHNYVDSGGMVDAYSVLRD